MVRSQERERLGVALLERGEHLLAESAHLAAELERPLAQDRVAMDRLRGLDVAERAGQVDPRGRRAHQEPRLDRRLEQRQLLRVAGDVQAVADLEQPIGDALPRVGHERVVARHAEVEARPERGRRVAGGAAVRRITDVRQVALDLLQHGVAERVDPGGGQVVERPRSRRLDRDLHRPRPEDPPGQHVELGRLVDRLERVPSEQLVTPRDQVVDVLLDDRLGIGGQTQAGDRVRGERLGAPGGDLRKQVVALGELRRIGTGVLEQEQQLGDRSGLGVPVAIQLEERPQLPGSLQRLQARGRLGRVEDVVEPALRVRELLVGAEAAGDRERDVEEDLPVVGGVGTAVREVDVVDGKGRLDRLRGIGRLEVVVAEMLPAQQRLGSVRRGIEQAGDPGRPHLPQHPADVRLVERLESIPDGGGRHDHGTGRRIGRLDRRHRVDRVDREHAGTVDGRGGASRANGEEDLSGRRADLGPADDGDRWGTPGHGLAADGRDPCSEAVGEIRRCSWPAGRPPGCRWSPSGRAVTTRSPQVAGSPRRRDRGATDRGEARPGGPSRHRAAAVRARFRRALASSAALGTAR